MEIVKSDQQPLRAARRWAQLSDEERKRAATLAAAQRDLTSDLSLLTLAESYLTLYGSAGAHVSKHTLAAYARGVRELVALWQGVNLLRPGRSDGALYVRTLEDAGLKPATVALKLAAARCLYRALRWSGATEARPFEDVRPARDKENPADKRDAYAFEEIERMLHAAAERDDWHGALLVLLGAHAGLRVSEMVSLSWANVNLQRGTLRVVGKGRKPAKVTLSRRLIDHLGRRPGKGPVFPYTHRATAHRKVVKLAQLAGVPPLGVHALRHSCGTRMRAEGRDPFAIAEHLRHQDLNTTKRYTKMVKPSDFSAW